MHDYKAPIFMLDLVLGTFMEWVGEGPFRNKGLIVKTLWYLVLFGPRVWDFDIWGWFY